MGDQQLWGAWQCWERGLGCMKGNSALREFVWKALSLARLIQRSLPVCQNSVARRESAFPLPGVSLPDLGSLSLFPILSSCFFQEPEEDLGRNGAGPRLPPLLGLSPGSCTHRIGGNCKECPVFIQFGPEVLKSTMGCPVSGQAGALLPLEEHEEL